MSYTLRTQVFADFFCHPRCRPTGGALRPLSTMFLLLRRVLEKPVPYVRFWLNDNVLEFGPQSCSPFSASRPASIRTLGEPCPARCKLGSLVSFQVLLSLRRPRRPRRRSQSP